MVSSQSAPYRLNLPPADSRLGDPTDDPLDWDDAGRESSLLGLLEYHRDWGASGSRRYGKKGSSRWRKEEDREEELRMARETTDRAAGTGIVA